jgi:two-component system invasion response regulator UvrY
MRTALIADDHEVTRRGIREILQDEFPGVEIVEVGDAAAVLAQLHTRKWDLMLLDVMMPGGTIVDLLRKIRATHADVPALVLTAATEVEYVTQTMRAGANGLVHKHRAADELVAAIKVVVEGGVYLHPETEHAVALTLRDAEPGLPHKKLSYRELQIFRLIARGREVKEIAVELGLSDKTVATYLARIREKTGLGNHVEIARYALHHKIVE